MAISSRFEPQPREKPPVVAPGYTLDSVTDQISSIVLTRGVPREWYVGFAIAFSLLMLLFYSISYIVVKGVGVWGIKVPVSWGFAIVNMVWWIGIGHAGTLISAILLLLRQEWRTSINRFAEAMTLFALACAVVFPTFHLGRPWLAHWLAPYPNAFGVWPQFRSPLIWDFFAISTYGLVSLMFWYVGLVPDLATLRDRATNTFSKMVYGFFALGWRGSARHWRRYNQAYYLLAALATPLVVSVHTIVSFDFAVGIVPGWHSTIYPPFFVAGAIFSGFAMVLTLSIPLRAVYGLQGLITMHHLENMGKVMLTSGMFVTYGYIMETFGAWYSGNQYEIYATTNRMFGEYAPYYWAMITCNALIPQVLWFRRVRTNVVLLFMISIVVNIGMWLERFVIVVITLSRDFIPSAWDTYSPTFWDISLYIGTFGLFFTLMFLFLRILPAISIFEMRELVEHKQHNH